MQYQLKANINLNNGFTSKKPKSDIYLLLLSAIALVLEIL